MEDRSIVERQQSIDGFVDEKASASVWLRGCGFFEKGRGQARSHHFFGAVQGRLAVGAQFKTANFKKGNASELLEKRLKIVPQVATNSTKRSKRESFHFAHAIDVVILTHRLTKYEPIRHHTHTQKRQTTTVFVRVEFQQSEKHIGSHC